MPYDYFSTTEEAARQSLGTLGTGLQTLGLGIAKRKEQEAMRNQGHQLLQQFGIVKPDGSIDHEKSKELGVEIKSSGEVAIKPKENLSDLMFMNLFQQNKGPSSPDEIRKNFIAQNPQYNEKDINVEPLYSNIKGQKVQTGWEPKVNEKAREARIKGEQEDKFIKDSASDMLDTINEVEKGINNFGFMGQLPSIPGFQRSVWEANVNKLLSGKIVNLITQMKSTSKTGATGFGQLSDKEGQILREASTALKRQLPPGEAKKILDNMKSQLQKVVNPGYNFSTLEEAEKANLPKGTEIVVGGRRAVVQ